MYCTHNENEVICGVSQTVKRHAISRAMDVRTDQRVPQIHVDYAKWGVCGTPRACLSPRDHRRMALLRFMYKLHLINYAEFKWPPIYFSLKTVALCTVYQRIAAYARNAH